jgi:hypothetical protein
MTGNLGRSWTEIRMPGVAAGLSRRSWSIGSARFMRDVFASVLATGIAAVGFSHLSHEPAPPAPDAARSKNLDRLTWEVEDVPTRATRTYDSIAMFALPRVEASAWSEAAPQADSARTSTSLRAAQIERRERETNRLAILPPTRPSIVVATAATPAETEFSKPVLVAAAQPARGLQVLGWQVPGTDLIPAVLPDGRDVLKGAAAIGNKVSGMGQSLAETVGLK